MTFRSFSDDTRSGLINVFLARGLFLAHRLLPGGRRLAPSRSEFGNARFLLLHGVILLFQIVKFVQGALNLLAQI